LLLKRFVFDGVELALGRGVGVSSEGRSVGDQQLRTANPTIAAAINPLVLLLSMI
jgi:hypothetical protein